MEQFKKAFFKETDSFLASWKLSYGYVQIIRFLSIAIMLNADKKIVDKIIEMVKKANPKDFLIDALVSYYDKDWSINESFTFPKPYIFIKEIFELAKSDKSKASFKLKYYLDNLWYKGHKDCGWYDMHKINKSNYIGYWSFESGALVKILGLDDSILKDQQYYPYDLVHYKKS
ncbi:PoNe immunity protein domain-containing protein [Pasteurella sp. PK-2025]|uniref:PoNe immunity protein domain-containing protein n=1 Tax=Pasteurella sp. PK-2025 TaxID=3413133 RepID=UPI003C776275